jgi:hypothetical protein
MARNAPDVIDVIDVVSRIVFLEYLDTWALLTRRLLVQL